MKSPQFAIVAGLLCATAATAMVIRQQTQNLPYVVPSSVITDAYHKTDGRKIDTAIGAVCSVSLDSSNKAFDIDWALTTTAQLIQTIPVGFTPTDISIGTTPYEFIVAGTSSTGKTRLIKYNFDPPIQLANGTLAPADLDSSQVLLSLPRQGALRNVVALQRNLGKGNAYFIRFRSTGDVYEFDATSGQLGPALVSGNTPSSAPIYVPELAAGFRYRKTSSFEHIVHGYGYNFMPSTPTDPLVILFDNDKDGNLDYHILINTAADYAQYGLDTGITYP